MILYHGSQNEAVEPSFGRGDDRHDFGRRFYLTDSAELAGEWSVCRPESHDGWIHAFDLDLTGLKVFDFREVDPLAQELMRYYQAEENVTPKEVEPLRGFLPNWMGQFYAQYQWQTGGQSREIVKKVPPGWLATAYPGLHDLDLSLAVAKVLANDNEVSLNLL